MAIPLTGSGSLGVRLGHIFAGAFDGWAYMGGPATTRVLSGASLATRLTNVLSDFAGGTALPKTISDAAATFNTVQTSSLTSLLSWIKSKSQATLISMVAIDQGLSETAAIPFNTALNYLVTQMQGASSSFASVTPTLGTQTNGSPAPTGNPILVGNVKDGRGGSLQCLPTNDTLTLTCTSDSYSGGATAYQETYSLKGLAAVSDPLSYLWYTGGTGASITLTAVNAALNNSTGQMLYNGDFASFVNSSNIPDQWVLVTGAAGTNITNGTTSNAYVTGGGSVSIIGDAATLTSITQSFNTSTSTSVNAGGTPATLSANTNYAVNCWIKVNVTPAAGVLEFALVDGSGNVINDDTGSAQSFTKSLTAVSTSFVNVNGILRLPVNPPTTVKLRMRLSTALSSGTTLYVSHLAFAKTASLGTLWPSFALFSGSTKAVAGTFPDSYTMTLANSWGTGSFMQAFERFWGIRSLGVVIPNSASPTVADSLIS